MYERSILHTRAHTHTLNSYKQPLMRIYFLSFSFRFFSFCTITQLSSDGNQTTSTLSITLSRADSGRYLSCRAYNPALQSETLEDGWRLDIQCEFKIRRKLFSDLFIYYCGYKMHVNEMYLSCTTTQRNIFTPRTQVCMLDQQIHSIQQQQLALTNDNHSSNISYVVRNGLISHQKFIK